jgi:hypothetical protein
LEKQRENWNTLLLNSVNMILSLLPPWLVLQLLVAPECPFGSQTIVHALIFCSHGDVACDEQIQPSQLAEEQRNATRMFKQIQTQIQTMMALGLHLKKM